jgi:hypothetical protein
MSEQTSISPLNTHDFGYAYPSITISVDSILDLEGDAMGGKLTLGYACYADTAICALEAGTRLAVRELEGSPEFEQNLVDDIGVWLESNAPVNICEIVDTVVLPALATLNKCETTVGEATSWLDYATDPEFRRIDDNSCNWDSAFDKNLQFTQIQHALHDGECTLYGPTMILLESRSGDPRGGYDDQTFYFGNITDLGVLEGRIGATTEEDHYEAVECFTPQHIGGYCALANILEADEKGQLPEGYAVVRDDTDCPCFEGVDLQMTCPEGNIFTVGFYWEGEYLT